MAADADFFFTGWNYGMKIGRSYPRNVGARWHQVYEFIESCAHVMETRRIEDMYKDLLSLGRIFEWRHRLRAS